MCVYYIKLLCLSCQPLRHTLLCNPGAGIQQIIFHFCQLDLFQLLIMEAEEGNTREGRRTCSFLFILFLFYGLYLSCSCSFQFPVFLHSQHSRRGTCTSWPWRSHVALVLALRDPFSKLLGSYSPQALPSVPLATFYSQDFCDKFSIPFCIFSVLQYLFN